MADRLAAVRQTCGPEAIVGATSGAYFSCSVIFTLTLRSTYPVRALYASGVNILVTYPDTMRTIEALRSLDFVAVSTHAMTPTAEQADQGTNNVRRAAGLA